MSCDHVNQYFDDSITSLCVLVGSIGKYEYGVSSYECQ